MLEIQLNTLIAKPGIIAKVAVKKNGIDSWAGRL
jgi:hypothetical protein